MVIYFNLPKVGNLLPQNRNFVAKSQLDYLVHTTASMSDTAFVSESLDHIP